MDFGALQEQVLAVLADYWDSCGALAPVEAEQIAEIVDEPLDEVKNAIATLDALGLVETEFGNSWAALTADGYREARVTAPGSRGPGGGTSIVFHGPVSNSAIAAGGSQATVTNTSYTVLQELAREIESRPDIPTKEKQGLVEAAKKLAAHPLVAAALGAVLGRVLGP